MQPLLAAPRDGLTLATVTDSLKIDRAVKVRHGVDVLDTQDRITDQKLKVLGGSVTWAYRPPDRVTNSTTDVASVRRTCQLDVVGLADVQTTLQRFRPWTEWLARTGDWVRWELGVFVATLPTIVDDGLKVGFSLALADKSYRLLSRTLADPLTVPAGTDPVNFVKARLTSEFGETRYNIPGTLIVLADDMTFDAGTNELEVANALLKNAGLDNLTFDENGIASSTLLADIAGRGPELVYGPATIADAARILTAGQTDPLLPSLPNQVRFVARNGPTLPEEGNGIVTVTNQSTGPASVDRRGETVELRVDVDAEDQATLAAIAAADAQRYFAGGGHRFTGKVALNPRHSDRDVVELVKPRLGLSGVWQVTSWTYPLQPIASESAVLMDLTCEQRVVVV